MKGIGCLFIFALIALNLFVGGYATQYDVEVWGAVIIHHAVAIALLPCIILGLFIGQFTIPVAILTWVLKLAGLI